MTFIALTLGWIAFLLFVLLIINVQKADKYKRGFRDAATQLYNVTAERNELSIANVGLQSRLDKMQTAPIKMSLSADEYKQALGRAERAVTTLKPEHRE